MERADEATRFLLDLAAALHGAYMPANDVERRVGECARGLGLRVEAFTLQTLAAVEAQGTRLRRIELNAHWNLRRLHYLLDLCAEVAGKRMGLAAARAELERIAVIRSPFPLWLVVLAYGAWGAAVTARVGGRGWEMLAACLIGFAAGVIHLGILGFPTTALQKTFFGSFVATLAAFALRLLLPPFDVERAIFGALTLLLPAMIITIGVSELASEAAAEAGVMRLAYGLFRFLMMALGIVVAGKLWLLFGDLPTEVQEPALPRAAVAAILVPGGLALVACVQSRRREAGWVVAAVLFAWGVQELTKVVFEESGRPFIAAFALGVFAQLYARRPGRVPATVVFPGLMQLAPGFLGTEAVVALLRPSLVDGNATFLRVLMVGLQLVIGLMASTVVRGRRARPVAPVGA